MIDRRRTFRPIPQAPKPFLYPAGTILADIPPFSRGLTEMQYLDVCIEKWKKLGPEPIPAQPVAGPSFGQRRRAR
jgi:hypothetical protein